LPAQLIEDACNELENLKALIAQATKDALMNPNDKEAQKVQCLPRR
jgi:hypothetical protein